MSASAEPLVQDRRSFYCGSARGQSGSYLNKNEVNLDAAELDRRLAELQQLIQDHRDEMDDAFEAQEALENAAREAGAGRYGSARQFLAAVAMAAGEVTAITTAVQALRDVLT